MRRDHRGIHVHQWYFSRPYKIWPGAGEAEAETLGCRVWVYHLDLNGFKIPPQILAPWCLEAIPADNPQIVVYVGVPDVIMALIDLGVMSCCPDKRKGK